MKKEKIAFLTHNEEQNNDIVEGLRKIYGDFPPKDCDVIVALGGDGFMLNALHTAEPYGKPVYGMNQGTIGFLMNKFSSSPAAL